MKQALSEAFARYGMSVAVTHGEKKTQTKAFLQPVKRENGEEPFSVTPLGAVSDECWRYLGPAEVEIAMGDLVQSGAREYDYLFFVIIHDFNERLYKYRDIEMNGWTLPVSSIHHKNHTINLMHLLFCGSEAYIHTSYLHEQFQLYLHQ